MSTSPSGQETTTLHLDGQLLKTIAHPTALRTAVLILYTGHASPGDLVRVFDRAAAELTRHLSNLIEAEILTKARRKTAVLYSLTQEHAEGRWSVLRPLLEQFYNRPWAVADRLSWETLRREKGLITDEFASLPDS